MVFTKVKKDSSTPENDGLPGIVKRPGREEVAAFAQRFPEEEEPCEG
jgi:hypothetical protein